jgi:hypothetical protein
VHFFSGSAKRVAVVGAGVRLVHSHSSSLKIFGILNLTFDEASSVFVTLWS